MLVGGRTTLLIRPINTANMADVLGLKCTTRLSQHLSDVNPEPLSRVSYKLLRTTALPSIGSIELVSGENFSKSYDALYQSMFKPAERERSDLIVERLEREFANQRAGLAPYRVVGIKDHDGFAIGAAQFSVLYLQGENLAVPYLQYIYVRSENRRQYMADILHTLVLAVSTADAVKVGRTVPFTLFETHPPSIIVRKPGTIQSAQTAEIHAKAGAVALMLRENETGRQVTPHVQPGLEKGEPPISLIWAIRDSPANHEFDHDLQSIGKGLIAAYYQSLHDEGFPEDNIRLAEELFAKQCENSKFELIPICELDVNMVTAI
jgi:hypothetical protein